MKKKVLAALLASTMVFGLAACGNNSSKETTADTTAATSAETSADAGAETSAPADDTTAADGETITIWAWDESFNIVAANQAKEIYQAENPGVNVEVVTMAQDDIVTKLNTSLSSGSYDGLPDIVLIEDYRIQGYLTSYGDEFADLSSIVSADDFASYKTGVTQKDGVMYGVPFDSGVAATFYRTDLIEEAGYTQADMEDMTWEKYIEIGKAVKEKTGKNMLTLDPSDIGQIRMMLQSAGAWYTDADGNVTLADNQALKDAITIYKSMVEADIATQISGWDPFVGAFNNGDVASVITGCWIASSVKNAEDQSGNWAVAAFPKMEANSSSVNASSIGGAGWYVLKNVGHEATAVDFLGKTFASSTDLMNQLAADINLVSTLTAAESVENYSVGDEFFGGQEVFNDFAAWTQEVPTVNYSLHTYAIESIVAEAVQAIVDGADMDETLADYQAQAEAAVAQ